MVRLARCTDSTCTGHTVRDVGPGESPSLAIGNDGLALIAYGNRLEETAVLTANMGSPDALEGGMAFVERREPVWRASVAADCPAIPALKGSAGATA